METIECSKCGAIFEKTGAKDKLRRFKDKRFMTTFHCPNCDARVILKNGDEPISIYLKRLERLKEQARRLGDRQEVNELQDEIDQINREIKMNAGKTKDKKFSVKGKDAGYDPTTPKNIAKAKALSVAQGKAASDAKDDVNYLGEKVFHTYESWKIACKRVNPNVVFEGNKDICNAKPGIGEWDGVTGVIYKTDDKAYDPLAPENITEEKELAKARGAAAADVKDSLFKGQKVTAIKSEQGLREGETYTVFGEEEIIKQIVGEDNTTVYKLQDSSGNIIVIEDCDGLFYEVKDAKTKDVTYPEDFVQYGWKLQQNGRQLIATHPEHNLEYRGTPYEIVPKLQRWLTDYNISKMGNKDEEPNEEENESLKVKIGDIRKNMDAARKMGFDTEPYQKEIDKLETKDSLSYVTTYKGYEIASSDKNRVDKFLTTSKGTFLAANTLEELKKKIDKLETKDAYEGANIKNGYYAAMTGKARTENPFTKGTPEYTEWDRKWKIGNEDFKYESNKELFKSKDSDDKELKEMLVNDAPDYYSAIVTTARRGNNPQMGSKEVRKNIEPFMTAHGVQFNEEEFNKAYKEFSKAGISKAAFMKGADAKTKDALMECMECGHKFKKNLSPNTFEVKCPKCGGYDVDVISGDSKTKDDIVWEKPKDQLKKELEEAKKNKNYVKADEIEHRLNSFVSDPKYKDSSDFYTKDPLTKKGQKILAAMKKAYGEEKGEQIFYATRNKGKISGVDKKTKDDYKRMTLAELQKKAKEGYFELQSDPKPRNHVEIKYPDGKKEWVFVEDQEIKIIIGDDPVNPSPAEQKVEGNDVIYKEYTLKQLPETGEFEIYAPGGSIVGHAKALELAKLFVDRIIASKVMYE